MVITEKNCHTFFTYKVNRRNGKQAEKVLSYPIYLLIERGGHMNELLNRLENMECYSKEDRISYILTYNEYVQEIGKNELISAIESVLYND